MSGHIHSHHIITVENLLLHDKSRQKDSNG
jgi:hypothetical protein